MKKLSFIIPCYRSENTIESVVREIIENVLKLHGGYDYEIIAINDQSPDNVYEVLKRLAKENRKIKAVSMAKNFGQHAGMIAGVNLAAGDYIVFLDDDGQCPIDRLEDMISPLENGWDISIAQYGKKKQSMFKNMCSSINERAANLLIDKPRHLQMGNFMAIKRFVADEIKRYKGPYPYISGLLFRSSARIINVPMEERVRLEGNTTYTLKKLFSLWLNSFTAFSIKPLRMATFFGSLVSVTGFIYCIVVVCRKIMTPAIAVGWSSLMAVLLLLGGMILLVLGLIGEYLGRIYMSLNETPQYVIRETVNVRDENEQE